MLMEHAFISTASDHEVLERGEFLLADLDFQPMERSANHLVMRKGAKTPSYAKTVDRLPQLVRMECNRGRVDVAVHVEERGRLTPPMIEMAGLIANLLESGLAPGASPETHMARWQELKTELSRFKNQVGRAWRIFLWVLLALIFGFILLIIIGSTTS